MLKLIPTLFGRYDIELTEPDAIWTMTSWYVA